MNDQPGLDAAIRTILTEHGRLVADVATLSRDADLYAAGLTSHASITIMLALEDHWDLEFPQQMLKKGTFGSVGSIAAALTELGVPT